MTRSGRSAREFGATRRSVGRHLVARGGTRWRPGSRLGLPMPGKMTPPATSCERHGRRNGLEEGREARGEREDAGGGVSHLLRALEWATHLGGFC